MKLPSVDHPITIHAVEGCLLVRFRDSIVAKSSNALLLEEANYAPVYYIPKADIFPKFFIPSHHSTYCPYKGHASYYSLSMGTDFAKDAVWVYEQPYHSMSSIKDHVAFYTDQVSFDFA